MKARLIEELIKAPVKREKKRVAVSGPMQVIEESRIDRDSYGYAEKYRFQAVIGAEFYAQYFDGGDVGRQVKHEALLRSVCEYIYGEVRAEMHSLYRSLYCMPPSDEQADAVETVTRVLEMTKP